MVWGGGPAAEERWRRDPASNKSSVQGAAHELRGAAGYLGAQRVAAASKLLEEHASLVTDDHESLELAQQSLRDFCSAGDEFNALCEAAPSLHALFEQN